MHYTLYVLLQKIVKRVLNKLTRIPVLGQYFYRLSDKFNNILFLIRENVTHNKSLLKFSSLSNVDEYFDFANEVFSSHQLKAEITSFLKFAMLERPQCICEIGTADGGTNFLLSQSIASVQLMIGIDFFVKNRVKLEYFSKDSQQLSFINGSSYAESTVNKVKQTLAGKQLDILFIDGDHTYEGVKQDFLQYCSFVRESGLIVFHDIVPDYSTRYGLNTGRWVGEVPRFYKKIKSFYPSYEFIENAEQDGLGIGVIRFSKKISIPKNL